MCSIRTFYCSAVINSRTNSKNPNITYEVQMGFAGIDVSEDSPGTQISDRIGPGTALLKNSF